MAKLHVRYMVGGIHPIRYRNASTALNFRSHPARCSNSAYTLGTHWNISLFHYRSHGTDYGRVLAAFELAIGEPDFETRLHELGCECHDESTTRRSGSSGGLIQRFSFSAHKVKWA